MANAAMLQHGYVGTEHILMAVAQDESSVSVRIFNTLGVSPDQLLEDVARAIQSPMPQTTAESGNASHPAQGGGKTPTARPVRPRSDQAGRRGQARPGDRTCQRRSSG